MFSWLLNVKGTILISVSTALLPLESQLKLRPKDIFFRLPNCKHFHIIGTMENKDAVNAFAALAQESRLAVLRLLVQNGPDGLTPGVICETLAMPAPTLSFHLKTLAQAGLIVATQEGRFVRYRAAMPAIRALAAFLTEDCCKGQLSRC